MFGKLMSIPDELIAKYYRLCTDASREEVAAIEAGLAAGRLHPAKAKRDLARRIVAMYHFGGSLLHALVIEQAFDQIHRERRVPDEVPERTIPEEAVRHGKVWLPRLLVAMGLAPSNTAALRLLRDGAVKLDGQKVAEDSELGPQDLDGRVLQVGRRRLAGGVRLRWRTSSA
jgi:tyrosyl-tRNA synthetase